MAATATIVAIIAQTVAGTGSFACPTEAAAVNVQTWMNDYGIRPVLGHDPLPASAYRQIPPTAVRSVQSSAADNDCAFLGVGAQGQLIGTRDGYVFAHWPTLGEDLWVPLRMVACKLDGLSPFNFSCG